MEDALFGSPAAAGGDGSYEGPAYEPTSSVKNFQRLPRFGHESDFTVLFSPYQDEQVDYAAGLIALFVFLLIIFIFWTVMIITFKVMGPANAGFLSGYHFVVPDPADDEKNIRKRPLRVRIAFLVATALLMVFAFLLVAMGLTNVNNAATTMGESLKTTEDLLGNAEVIARNLARVGENSISIRDAAVAELDDLCPANPNIADSIGMDIMGIAEQAKSDLTMLADFIKEGLDALDENLQLVRQFTKGADTATEAINLWDWEMKLLCAGLFILPAFLAVGVGLVMLDLDVKPYQKSLTYFFMPLFVVTTVATYIVCCLTLPLSASTADACSGGGEVRGGPDDTVMTIWRNMRGADTGKIYLFMAYYTQQCDAGFYPFEFLKEYLGDLDSAVESTKTAVKTVEDNQALLEIQCGRDFDNVVDIVGEMSDNLRVLKKQADLSLDLIKCENINKLYVNTVHEAGCTYSVDAMAWIFSSSLIISICGLTMIMLRAAMYPVEYLELSDSWSTAKPSATKSVSKDSVESTLPTPTRPRPEVHSHSTAPSSAPPVVVPQAVQVSQANGGGFEQGYEQEGFEMGHALEEL